jgi:integrase
MSNTNRYTIPRIYHGGVNYNLKEDWHVYYYFKSDVTSDYIKQNPIYYNVNEVGDTVTKRLKHVRDLRDDVELLLRNGYTPKIEYTTAKSALSYALSLKKNVLQQTSYIDYENRLSHFLKFLAKKKASNWDIKKIDKSIVNEFLNSILVKSSSRNRNNTKVVLSSLFSVLEENDFVEYNFVKNIKKLKTTPLRNKTYSQKKVEEIYEYLEENDKEMLLFIKFVSYNFLRPLEVVRLKVKDIDLCEKILQVRAKNKAVKVKIIPDILVNELLKLDLKNPNHLLFTPTGIGEWETEEINRREYFTKRFRDLKKDLNIGNEHTIYSFRHTFITKLFRHLHKEFGLSKTYDKLMLITGHNTLKPLQQYLRDVDAELPEDYSNLRR